MARLCRRRRQRAFPHGPARSEQICVTEAAIDAMSLAAIEGLRPDTLYVSTGGGWSPATDGHPRPRQAANPPCRRN